jgi:hypothetical protein
MRVDAAGAEAQRGFERFHHALRLGAVPAEAVLHDVERLAAAGAAFAVDARIALRLQVGADLVFVEVRRHRDREGEGDAGVRMRGAGALQRAEDAGCGVACHRPAAAAAEQRGRACEQQLQVVVQFGHRADRAAAGAHRIGLVDRDGGRHPADRADLRPVHAVEELARIR